MAHLAAFDISVSFPLYHAETRSLKKTILSKASGRFAEDDKHRTVVEALRDISFALREGDRLGLIGANGSGKTTLLRALSGIYQPARGSLSIEGRLTSLLDPSQGMSPDMTGRENVRLRGYFHGWPKANVARLEADVESFAGLDEFLDVPVRNYSAGMVVRLAFAMATAVRPEILLMDEWLLAGDAAFLEKARARIESMVRQADILVLASHAPTILMEWCNRLIWLDHGRIMADGAPLEVLSEYLPAPQFRALASTVEPAIGSEAEGS
ncbi:MAG: ABC transporter ATP-binding protein [Acetobacteraceae bacterium]